jgi:hypothetical protein
MATHLENRPWRQVYEVEGRHEATIPYGLSLNEQDVEEMQRQIRERRARWRLSISFARRSVIVRRRPWVNRALPRSLHKIERRSESAEKRPVNIRALSLSGSLVGKPMSAGGVLMRKLAVTVRR